MKFYLSYPSIDSPADGLMSVKVNNISGRKEVIPRRPLLAVPEDSLIGRLNDLASRPPFCVKHKVKKYDPL